MNKFGFNFDKGRVDTSLHPFCGGFPDDIRITTKFNEQDFFSSFDALMHETGHALYEFGLPKKYRNQLLEKLEVCLYTKANHFLSKCKLLKQKNLMNF